MSVNTITNGNNGNFSSKHSSSYPIKISCRCNHQLLHTKNNHTIIIIIIMENPFEPADPNIPTIFDKLCLTPHWDFIQFTFK